MTALYLAAAYGLLVLVVAYRATPHNTWYHRATLALLVTATFPYLALVATRSYMRKRLFEHAASQRPLDL